MSTSDRDDTQRAHPLVPVPLQEGSAMAVVALAAAPAITAGIAALLAFRAYRPLDFAASTSLVESGWPLLATAAAVATAVASALSVVTRRSGEHLKTTVLGLAVIIGALDFAAIRGIEATRLIHHHDYLAVAMQRESASRAEVNSPIEHTPDPANGKQLYAGTCSACHGSGGEGKARTAPSLLGNAFAGGKDVNSLAEFLSVGRTPADPQSVMRMVMPARGGNPMLTDTDLKDLAAYVKQLAIQQAPSATSDGASGAAPQAPPFELHRTVVPPAAAGPPGLSVPYLATVAWKPTDPIPAHRLGGRNKFAYANLLLAAAQALLMIGGAVLTGLALSFASCVKRPFIGSLLHLAANVHIQLVALLWLWQALFLYGAT